MEGTIAEIRMFGGNFAPRGWALCQGQTMAINTNTALFSLLGTTFGGNGQTTFQLPNLAGRMPVGAGQGQGIRSIQLGEVGGTNTVTLSTAQMPAHTHTIGGTITLQVQSEEVGNQTSPDGNFLAQPPASQPIYFASTDGTTLAANSLKPNLTNTISGSSQPVDITAPYLGVNYIICLEGIFPSRN